MEYISYYLFFMYGNSGACHREVSAEYFAKEKDTPGVKWTGILGVGWTLHPGLAIIPATSKFVPVSTSDSGGSSNVDQEGQDHNQPLVPHTYNKHVPSIIALLVDDVDGHFSR